MFKHKHTCRKPDPLILLVIIVSLAALMTSTTAAADPFLNTLGPTDLQNGDLVVAPVGRHGAGVHLSYETSPYRAETIHASGTTTGSSKSVSRPPSLFLSVKIPW
jgi:hypothetical protein